jgi:hypothetical protein
LNLPARGPCFALLVRARRAKARERLPSYREPASRNPQAMHPETCWEPCTRAPFRLLSIRAPRQAVLRTSSWLAPSLFHQQVLRPPGGEDARCVQPTSATQSNYVHPHLARSRLALAAFAARTPRGVLGSTRHYRGNGRFTTSKTASADRDCRTDLELYCLTAWRTSVGVLFPRCASDRASDTPVVILSSPSRLRRFRDGCPLAVRPSFGRFRTGRRSVRTTKTTVNAVS